MNSLVKILITGLVCLCVSGAFAAQGDVSYPARPIRLMVPQNPGASVDNISRILAARMGEELGQQIVADNRPGAGGTLAAEVVAHAAPDGQTLFAVATGTAVISPQTFKKLSYDPIKDFEYISLFAITQNVLVVHPSLPVKSVRELVAYAKANPGKLNMANAGTASQSHLACVLFTHMAGIDVVHVPYKGGGASVTALMGNESQVTITPAPAVLSHVRAGRLRALGTGGTQRSPLMPDLPTIIESGVPGYQSSGWMGLLAPARTPKPILDRLRATLTKVVEVPATRELFERQGADPTTTTPAEFKKFVADEYARFTQAIKLANLKPE
ncbi:MAG: transporter substrate-binding protein [Betaproteobacteria bacterium]|nr:transporter substrate-binding protein [Betaproteobacteria bacterium]